MEIIVDKVFFGVCGFVGLALKEVFELVVGVDLVYCCDWKEFRWVGSILGLF